MIPETSLLVTLVTLVDRLPVPAPPAKRGRGRPVTYPDRLFLKALVIMIVRRRRKGHELLPALGQPTTAMGQLRALLVRPDGRCPGGSRRLGASRAKSWAIAKRACTGPL